jgi:hypothetical protein
MNKPNPHILPPPLTRRQALSVVGAGFGLVGLAGTMGAPLEAATAGAPASPLAPKQPHFPPKAKRVIYLFLSGS